MGSETESRIHDARPIPHRFIRHGNALPDLIKGARDARGD